MHPVQSAQQLVEAITFDLPGVKCLVAESQLPAEFRVQLAHGYTHADLAELLWGSIYKDANLAVISDEQLLHHVGPDHFELAVLSIAAHEAGHWYQFWDGRQHKAPTCESQDDCHGMDWIRAASHLVLRAEAMGVKLPAAWVLGGASPDARDPDAYIRAARSEHTTNLPALLNEAAPDSFYRLWVADLRADEPRRQRGRLRSEHRASAARREELESAERANAAKQKVLEDAELERLQDIGLEVLSRMHSPVAVNRRRPARRAPSLLFPSMPSGLPNMLCVG
jgi:hypothetical protein